MNRVAFTNYLNNYLRPNGMHLTAGAIAKRLSKAEEAETVLGHSLDVSVSNDSRMRTDLLALRRNSEQEKRYGQMQNALRKYYHMTYGRLFPRLKDIQKYKRIYQIRPAGAGYGESNKTNKRRKPQKGA